MRVAYGQRFFLPCVGGWVIQLGGTGGQREALLGEQAEQGVLIKGSRTLVSEFNRCPGHLVCQSAVQTNGHVIIVTICVIVKWWWEKRGRHSHLSVLPSPSICLDHKHGTQDPHFHVTVDMLYI